MGQVLDSERFEHARVICLEPALQRFDGFCDQGATGLSACRAARGAPSGARRRRDGATIRRRVGGG